MPICLLRAKIKFCQVHVSVDSNIKSSSSYFKLFRKEHHIKIGITPQSTFSLCSRRAGIKVQVLRKQHNCALLHNKNRKGFAGHVVQIFQMLRSLIDLRHRSVLMFHYLM